MKNKKPLVFIIRNEIYPFDVLVSIGETNEQFVKTISKNLPISAVDELEQDPTILKFGPTTVARTMMFDTGQIVIRMSHKPESYVDHGIIAHEIFHVVEFLFRHLSMNLTPDSSEAYAYLIGFLTTKFYEKL